MPVCFYSQTVLPKYLGKVVFNTLENTATPKHPKYTNIWIGITNLLQIHCIQFTINLPKIKPLIWSEMSGQYK